MKLFLFSLLLFSSLTVSARLVERVQAQVAEEMISLMDINLFQKRLKKGLVPPSLLLTQFFTKSELLKDKNKLLDFMIYRNLLAQIAEQKPLPEIPEKQIRESFNKLKGRSLKKSFSKKLKKVGMTPLSLKQEIRLDLKNDLLINQYVGSKISISEQDIESYHFSLYKKPLFKIFEYEFVSVSFPEKQKESFFKNLSKMRIKDLRETALFLGLEYKILKLKQKDLQKKFQRELDNLSISQVSPVFLSNGFYYLLQLKWKQPQVHPEEQKKRAEIEQLLYKRQFKEETKKWVKEKKRLFSISRHPF